MIRKALLDVCLVVGTLPVFAIACGGSPPPPPPPPPAASPPAEPPVASSTPAPAPAPAATQEEAHKLAVLAASCWFGGLWADALGEVDQVKQAGIEGRCHELERHVWGADDKGHYEQLRALEPNATGDVIAKVDTLAKSDGVDGPRRDALVKLTTALAESQREAMTARRAGDRVKRDLANEPEKLSDDEVAAVAPLRSHAKLEALYKLDAGDLSKEAHALALLGALDRVELARGLPKHLKLYAVADEFQLLFGVTIPDIPADATKKLVPGTWLRFLADTAAAAGHAVPKKAKTPKERDALAWGGMLAGFGDKLKAESDGVAPTTDLAKVVTTTLHRLEMEYRAQENAEASKQVHGKAH